MVTKAGSIGALHTHTHTHNWNSLTIKFVNKSKLALIYQKIEEEKRLSKHTKSM